MDTQQKSCTLTIGKQLPQAQLWIGSQSKLLMQVGELLQQRWCLKGGCKSCSICRLIIQQQYHRALWIAPAGKYTRGDLDPVVHALQFKLEPQSEFVIVIQKADYLTPACYNSLLKSVEEPPCGYHFILLAERLKEVASTIRSRCIVQNFSTETTDIRKYPLALYFSTCTYEKPFNFMQVLEQTDPSEEQTRELIDILLAHWILEYKQAVREKNQMKIEKADHALVLLEYALEEPPSSGSSKLFWKNLFVQFKW